MTKMVNLLQALLPNSQTREVRSLTPVSDLKDRLTKAHDGFILPIDDGIQGILQFI
jgi:hypothetical protein